MPPKRSQFRTAVIIGATAGAVLSIVTTFLLDVLYAESLGGTWRDAIVSDMQNMFDVTLDAGSLSVTMIFGLVIAFLSAFGALLGGVFAAFVYKLLTGLAGK